MPVGVISMMLSLSNRHQQLSVSLYMLRWPVGTNSFALPYTPCEKQSSPAEGGVVALTRTVSILSQSANAIYPIDWRVEGSSTNLSLEQSAKTASPIFSKPSWSRMPSRPWLPQKVANKERGHNCYL